MNVLIVGSGGREHAIAWKVASSPRLTRLFIAPGNPGSASCAVNLPLSASDQAGLVSFCLSQNVDLVIIGPEAPLAEGLADALRDAGVKVFGPSAAAAEIESSKAFAKAFMQRHAIPSARFAVFTEYQPAVEHLSCTPYPVVIKASGLAAGKGVFLPENPEEAQRYLKEIMVERALGDAGQEVVIEERLSGPEVSLLAFTDGKTVRPMLPAQDHKRLLDGDRGPNTGGMGAYAPVSSLSQAWVDEVVNTILQPAVDGLREEGRPFIGVLYAGLMLTEDGPKVLEFNCRFGDPETQALLPLLKSDLLEVALACTEGRLEEVAVEWYPGSAVCVVLAARGYPAKPESGQPIVIPENLPENVVVFHAGTAMKNGRLVTAGGRVLGVTGWGDDLESALCQTYRAVEQIQFDGMQCRRDIASHARQAYTQAGVNIDAGNRAVALMRESVKSTYNPRVLAGIGAFGGLYDAVFLKEYRHPVLVASTDGVGTKVALAAQVGKYRSIGLDIVNHCINDILVQGARPLFFLDYFATARLKPEITAEIVQGMSEACRDAGCVLLGGETAEMPGVYTPEAFDVAGTMVGVVERDAILPRTADLSPGDVLLGLRSSGPHTNGYSLIRKICQNLALDRVIEGMETSLQEALLAPHRSYLPLLAPILDHPDSPIRALAHLTGGGFIENIPRVLPVGLGAIVRRGAWPVPPLFQWIQHTGRVAEDEMYRVFNMGIGMVAVIGQGDVSRVQQALGEETWVIGELVRGERKVTLV
ncbi:phosphoribosylamine--glycine ligase [Anaerolinea thermolimosa]|uniref:phosphoribosylamine--glycine ligase n=1 Tax=Anaerolinea thermolimosa TaxID=229919 RepID=UPI000A011839|nr:phosphoribosylamine--glycine ligase [Anaerolinea thermolimosa]GAP05972.1 phosphoribosylamine--glycine ligase [Anaerolinea thermolimosa]